MEIEDLPKEELNKLNERKVQYEKKFTNRKFYKSILNLKSKILKIGVYRILLLIMLALLIFELHRYISIQRYHTYVKNFTPVRVDKISGDVYFFDIGSGKYIKMNRD